MKPLSFNQLAKLTAGASGGLIVTNAATSVAVMPTEGPQTMFGRLMRVGVPLLTTGGIIYGLPRNEWTQGAAVGAALVSVSQLMSMVTMMLGGANGAASGNGSNGQSGMGAATTTAVMGGGVPASQALSRGAGMGIDRSTELLEEENRTARVEMD